MLGMSMVGRGGLLNPRVVQDAPEWVLRGGLGALGRSLPTLELVLQSGRG